MTLAPGTVLRNRYRIVAILGQGGMGAVYQAVDESLGISVAVKENLFLTDEYSRQFQREANILAGLRHPNLPRVGDYFAIPSQGQYLIMDFIDGEDLRQRIERTGILPESDVTIIGAAICDALTYLHTRKPAIIHRDIKPGNIKVTPEGQVSLVDFGLAKVVIENQQTTTGARAMTPGYSPPEQYGTAPTDARTDIYSLGATLYACLTGAIPEDGLARATGKAELTPIRELAPKVHRKLAIVLEKALAVEQDERYQTAELFKKALGEAGGIDKMTSPQPVVTPPPASLSRPVEGSEPQADIVQSQPAYPMLQGRNSVPYGHRRKNKSLLPISLILVSALAVFMYLSPDVSSTVRDMLFPPEVTVGGLAQGTEIPGSTEETFIPISSALTPTPEPSITEIPEATETLSPSLTPSPTATPMGGGGGQIAFSSDRTGMMQVWIMNVDGSQQHPLTNISDGACKPSWSPDGNKIAFVSPCETRRDHYDGSKIFILNLAEGAEVYPLPVPPSPASDYDPAWSPDGTRIAFTSQRAGNPDIYIFNTRNNTLAQLTTSQYTEKYPAWSPTGNQIAFTRDLVFSQIWTMSDTGQFQKRFSLSGQINDIWPAWTPDGNIILFSQLSGNNVPGLYALRYEDRETSTHYRIPPLGQPDPGPVGQISVAPDGSWIAYEGWPDGKNHDIYIMTINGSNRIRLTTDKDFDFGPAWRPVPQN